MAIRFDNPCAFAPFYTHPVAFHGMRPDERRVALTIMCQVVEDNFTAPGDTPAPIVERDFNINFPGIKWVANTPPNVGDWVQFAWAGVWLWGKIAHVGYMPNGDYQLSVIHNPKEKGYPAW